MYAPYSPSVCHAKQASAVIYLKQSEPPSFSRPACTRAYISARCICISQLSVTSINALSSPGKRAQEWEINCQTMHSSHYELQLSSCQMISKHYWMSGCIIQRTSSTTTPPPPPTPIYTLWWICGLATKRSHYMTALSSSSSSSFPTILLNTRGYVV